MTIGPAPMCVVCKHLHSDAKDFSCDAYPDGIPDQIVMNQIDHRKPYEGDHGIQFEQKAGAMSVGQLTADIEFATA